MQETPFKDFHIPSDVLEYIRLIFGSVNDHVSQKFTRIPNLPEETLDISFIDKLSDFSGPIAVRPEWAVQVAAHFIGRLRHYRNYEVADIGVVVVFKRTLEVVGRKLILLQSKRLYPNNFSVNELEDFDYALGLGIAIRDSPNEATINRQVIYEFNKDSKYCALRSADRQREAIRNHFEASDIPVHYMMYNPLTVPCTILHPIQEINGKVPARKFGTRIVDALKVQEAMDGLPKNASPALHRLAEGPGPKNLLFGQSLEDFFYEVVSCRQGYQFHENLEGIHRLFERKSGPIFCVIELTIEQSSRE